MPRRKCPSVTSASSHAVWAMIIGLRGKATAMPVARSSDGAAWWAATTDTHGGWRISVNTIPAKPASWTSRASRCTPSQLAGSVITSRSHATHHRTGVASVTNPDVIFSRMAALLHDIAAVPWSTDHHADRCNGRRTR